MKLYERLSKIRFLENNYAFKFLFIAFLGIHIPLIGLIFSIVYFQNTISPINIIVFTLVFTLIATFVTLFVLKRLIKPIEVASKALLNYKNSRTVPKLPLDFTDEAGLLMSNIQETIEANEGLLSEKQDLMYLLSHDMKTYTENPAALAQLIINENPSQDIVDYSNLILDSTSKQSNFLETFITLLKEEDEISKNVMKVNKINFTKITSLLQEQLKTKLENKNIQLKINSNATEVYLKINEELLIRVLSNLLDNAIKFSYPQSTIFLLIDKEHGKFEVSVSDSGMGFDNSKSNDLFSKFTKMSRVGTANEKSTGIGLYLCRQIIRKSNGTISATSAGANKGSTFTLVLKVYK